jgi:dienelactone hydrolase
VKKYILISLLSLIVAVVWGGQVFAQTRNPEIAQSLDRGYLVFRPDGPGPHPAVVFLSGCSGFRPSFAPKAYEQTAEKLRRMGFVVVWADFLGRRNLTSCAFGGITQEEAARDAVGAALWLRSQPYVDAQRITVLGWSYGGGWPRPVNCVGRCDW